MDERTGMVIGTGMNTEWEFNCSHQLASSKQEITSLQQKLNQISCYLSIGVLLIAAVVFAIGLYEWATNPLDMFLTAVSLAVAAIP